MAVVKDLLAQRWSPAQISRALHRKVPDRPDWHPGRRDHLPGPAEAIYQELCSACTNAPSLLRTARNPGHWEGDVIVGPQHRSAIGTLVERHARYVKLIHLPRPDSFQLRDGLLRELAGLPGCYCSRSPGIKAARWRGIWTSPGHSCRGLLL